MLFKKAEMMNKRASQPKFKMNEILEVLLVEKGGAIADIGSGGGCFTVRFAEKVGLDGKVYAVDTNTDNLNYVKNYAEETQLTNIETVLAEENKIILPEKCDLIFLRNAFHHIKEPETYFRNLKRYLKPRGKIVIIDYKKRAAFNFITLMGHYVEEEHIQETMKNAGYELYERYDFLPEQSFNIFELK